MDNPEKYPSRSTPENRDIFMLGEEHLDLHFIRHYVADKQPQSLPLSQLEVQARAQTWDDETSDASPASIIDEYRRLAQSLSAVLEAHPEWASRIERIHLADYSHPVLIYKGVIVDGLHRLLHAVIAGEDSIQAHVLEDLPPTAFVSV